MDSIAQVFQNCKNSLAKVHFWSVRPRLHRSLAFDIALETMMQKINGRWQPLAFMNKKLSRAQIKYSSYDRNF